MIRRAATALLRLALALMAIALLLGTVVKLGLF